MSDARATALEFIDQPECDPALAAASYRFMEIVNRRFGGIRIVRRFIAREAAGRTAGAPLRVLDIGSGSCDIPLAISLWARMHRIPLHITCLETSGRAVDIARDRLARADDPAVRLLHEDVFSHQPLEPYDCAVASLCFHHFSDAQILALLQRLRGFVIGSLLINDLRRSRLASLGAGLLLACAHKGVRHDALLSIRRGFTAGELTDLARQAGCATCSVEHALWFRIAATVTFTPREIL